MKKCGYILVGSLIILVSAFCFSNVSADDNTIDTVAIGVPISCSMEGTGMNSHNASIPNGTYLPEIGTTTLKAYCNDNEGFAIFAIGYSNNEYGNTNLIGTNLGYNIVTGTATSAGNPDTSNWAMKLATDSTATYPITLDNSFGSYSAVPTTYTKVAHRNSLTDIGDNAVGASLTTTYAAYISKTQNADTYSGKVKYTLVHPSSEEPTQPVACQAYSICYNANASNVVGQMDSQYASANSKRTLYASNYKRNGYGFAGWNDAFDYSGNYYGPNQDVIVSADIGISGLSLYAVWVKSAGTMQNWNGCNSLAQGSVTALTDERDGDTYAVAKLADGKCWMIENLRLADKDSDNNDINLTSLNTHNPSLPLTNIYDSSSTSNHLSPNSSVAYNATTAPEGWCTDFSAACYNQSRLRTDNTVLFINNTSSNYSYNSNVYSFGNYYNWYSATAGHGIYSTSSDAAGDICFAGWYLPTLNDFNVLYTAFGGVGVVSSNNSDPTGTVISQQFRSYPNNFVYSGQVSGASLDSTSTGYYWTASGDSPRDARHFYFQNTVVRLDSRELKYVGKTMRCIAGT